MELIIGILSGTAGGGLGGTILSAIGAPDLAEVAGGGVGGGAVLALVGVVRNMIGK